MKKTIRNPSPGHLTPLPDDESEPNSYAQSIIDQLQKNDSTDETLEVDPVSENLINDILTRHQNWNDKKDVESEYIDQLQAVMKSGDDSEITKAIQKSSIILKPETNQETLILQKNIETGLSRIKDLDLLLKEKTQVARELKHERISRQGTTTPGSLHDTLSDDDGDDFELKSVHSMETRTFITEPKIANRIKVALKNCVSINAANLVNDKGLPPRISTSESKNSEKPKNYKKGDFINRNIVLGPSARFYSAMTKEEESRVETILKSAEYYQDDLIDVRISFESEYSGISFNSAEEINNLTEIDK